jgi:hypothetical protein
MVWELSAEKTKKWVVGLLSHALKGTQVTAKEALATMMDWA